MSKKRMSILAVLAMMLVGVLMVPSGAMADSTCITSSNGNVTCVDQTLTQVGQAVDQESSSATAVGHAKAGVTYLVSMHLKLNEQKALSEGQCGWFKKAWVAGFVNGSGMLGWKLDHHVHACRLHGRLIKIGGGMTGLDCHNLVRLQKPKGVVKGKVEFVDHMTWQATAQVESTATATVGVSVSVHNADNSCQASASSTATSQGVATASATATASSKVKALSAAQGKMALILNSVHQTASTSAVASAKSSATAKAEAKASCSPSTIPGPPPVTFSMVFDTINDIPVGTCRPETLHVTTSAAGQIQISPQNGLISTVDCYQPDTGQKSMVTPPVLAGSTDLIVYVYESNDTSATSDTLTAVPLISGVDSAKNTVTTTFTVSHPTRP